MCYSITYAFYKKKRKYQLFVIQSTTLIIYISAVQIVQTKSKTKSWTNMERENSGNFQILSCGSLPCMLYQCKP